MSAVLNAMGIARIRMAAVVGCALCLLAREGIADDLGETRQIRWTGLEAADLRAKAEELGSAAAIYEYVRNNYEFAVYDGARSDSINVFGHRMGNDVDLATLLIAMLRSREIPSRYATGRVSITYDALTSWLEIPHDVRAATTLGTRGYFDLEPFLDRVEFSRVWTQALVPLDRYRAAGAATSIDCATQPTACTWVDLDPSFKLHRDPVGIVDVSDQVVFDYNAFYSADKPGYSSPDGIERANKNPLEIFEDQVLRHLRSNPDYDGKTLEDVIYQGEIVPEEAGIVPTSPPFLFDPSDVRVFPSVDDHDAAASQPNPSFAKWEKKVWFSVKFSDHPELGQLQLTTAPVYLSELSSKELTLAYESADFDDPAMPRDLVVRFGEDIHEILFSFTPETLSYSYAGGGNGSVTAPNAPGFDTEIAIDVSMEATARSPTASDVMSRVYLDQKLGGFFVIGAGGQFSSWGQVHASADRLNSALEEIPIVIDPTTGDLLIDDGDGLPGPQDVPLISNAEAQRRIGIGGGVKGHAAPLPHHRAYGSVHGGSVG